MRFPAYWARGTAEQIDANGKSRKFTCWGTSDVSEQDARATATERAMRALSAVMAHGYRRQRYPYGSGLLREEVMQRFTNAQGELIAAVTTTSYGALVLNTAGVMFVDVDFPPVRASEDLRHLFKRLFRRASTSPEAVREQQAYERVARTLQDLPGWSARIYRTCAGLRLLVTHDVFDPAADATRQVFETLGADPMYARLCRNQQSFRARLTPKPWRCGHTKNTIPWPRETREAQAAFDSWQTQYVACQADFATCRLIDAVGNGATHPDAEQVIAVHDRIAKVDRPLPLA